MTKSTKKILIGVVGLAIVGAIVGRGGSHDDGSGPLTPRSGADRLAELQRQHADIVAQVQPCLAQLQEALNEQAAGAINGEFVRHEPPCAANMPQWQATMALLEKQIYQLQTGANLPVRDFAGPLPGDDDRAHNAVERADIVGIRGHTRYVDESGRTYELDTAPYYFRDRASGQLFRSDLPDPPADGRDYEVLRALD